MAHLAGVMADVMEKMMDGMMTKGKIWHIPLEFPNRDEKFHYFAASKTDPKGSIVVLRHGESEAKEVPLTAEVRDELMGTGAPDDVRYNMDIKDLKNVANDAARAALRAALGEDASAGAYDDDQSAKLFSIADKDISSFFGGFKSVTEQLEAVEKALSKGADPNFGDEDATVLSRLAYNGHVAALRLILTKCGDKVDVNKTTEYLNTTALREACRASRDGAAEIVRMLLAAGADPTIRSSNDETPLHCLADDGGEGSTAAFAASLLIEAGLDPNDKGYAGSDKGKTPLEVAAERKAYTDKTKQYRADLVACLKDPASFKAKREAWEAAAKAAAAEAATFASDFDALLEKVSPAPVRAKITSVSYCLGGGTNLSLTFSGDGDDDEIDCADVILEQDADEKAFYPASCVAGNTNDGRAPVSWNFTKSIWGNFFKREINFAPDCMLFAQNDDNVWVKFSSKCLMDESDYDGPNNWAGVTLVFPKDKKDE